MKNQSRDFATMSDDERRKFALEDPTDAETTELDFDDPRNPERRGGASAQLDDEEQEDSVRDAERRDPDRRDDRGDG